MTHKAALPFGIGASLLLAAGAANAAGTCATEVQALQQQLGATESPNATIGTTSPGTQQPAPQANSTTGNSTTMDNGQIASQSGANATTGATIGATSPGTQQPQNQDMSATSNTYGSGSSSSKMPSGTVTETTRSGELNMSASSRAAALASLKKAELYAKAGEETACMSELSTAKQRMGVQ